ncbi:MATE family efflux transporter [Lachnospiraceae bacterium OttesenSCG-928-D06]|nr:MATE family efflux transporter [Lachnospiraceae bacterium OttesenSCG-928-D06]
MKKLIGNKAFYKMVLLVAVPIMVQNGITNFVNLLDNIMVGRIGTEQMSGIAIVNQLMMVFNVTIFGVISGAGIFGAQFAGCKDHKGVRNTFRFKIISCFVMLVLGVFIFLAFGEQLIMLYLNGEGNDASLEAALYYGKQYLLVILLSLPPLCVEQMYSSTLRECGETILPMKAGIAAVLVNLVLNYLLIFGTFGFPQMGVIGAAIATVIARYIQAVIVVLWTHQHAQQMPFIVGAYKELRIPKQLVQNIMIKGTPLILNEFFWSAGMATLTQCYSIRGLEAVAALNIASVISNLFNVVFLAMGNSVSIIIGQLLGAGKMEEAKDTDAKLIAFSVGSCVLIGSVLAIFAPLFPMIYNTTDRVKELATGIIRVAALCMPMAAFTHATYFTLRSGGKTVITFLFDSVFMMCVNVPIAYVLSRYTLIPLILLYFCCQAIDIIKCIVGFVLVKKGVWLQNIVASTAAD